MIASLNIEMENYDSKIDISVYMLTYYHEKYIRQAIESVLKQKTKYKFEIVISDDNSKDSTQDIINEYQKKYPDLIRVNINKDNIGIPKNIYKARCMCRGKYIVGLSGDDYWIDYNKLEKECDFLEKHSEYIAVFNCIELRYDDDLVAYDILPRKNFRNKEFSIYDYQKGKVLYSHGFMMRNFFLSENGREYFAQAQLISNLVDDAVDIVLILKKGRVFIVDEITDAHRVTRSDNSTKHNYNSRFSRIEKFNQRIDLLNNLDSYFNKSENSINFRKKYEDAVAIAKLDLIVSRQYKAYKESFNKIPVKYRKPFITSIFITSLPYCIKFIVNRIIAKIKRHI